MFTEHLHHDGSLLSPRVDLGRQMLSCWFVLHKRKWKLGTVMYRIQVHTSVKHPSPDFPTPPAVPRAL